MKRRIFTLLLALALLLLLAAPVSAGGASLSTQKLTVDGVPVECEKYNIGGNNYFKLRDVAYLLNGTETQFSVGWDGRNGIVSIIPGQAYVPNGCELDVSGPDKSRSASRTTQTILFDGKKNNSISVYNIGGNNYFKLRDLGDQIGFGVDYDSATNTVVLSTRPENADFLDSIPAYSGSPCVTLNGDQPGFSEADKTTDSFESYSALDTLGRCGAAFACVGTDLMPTSDREEISMIRPSGWQTVRYDDLIEDGFLYNRCHLIAFCLTGENANDKNLITGTQYMNTQGMLPYETMVASYVRRTHNHVLYRATPVFRGNDLVAEGVQLEALSVEDRGSGICFNVFVYNVQPGISIAYHTGSSTRAAAQQTPTDQAEMQYVLNVSSLVFHRPDCAYAKKMSIFNRKEIIDEREDLIEQGYKPCSWCNP